MIRRQDRSGRRYAGRTTAGEPDRAASPAVIAGWLVMGLFLLAGLLAILASSSAAFYRTVFIGLVLPLALLGLGIGLVLLLGRS